MITLAHAYIVAGLFFAAMSVLSIRDASNKRRIPTFLFWGMLAASFLAGGYVGDLGNGLLALGLVAVATLVLAKATPRRPRPRSGVRARSSAATYSSCPRSSFPL